MSSPTRMPSRTTRLRGGLRLALRSRWSLCALLFALVASAAGLVASGGATPSPHGERSLEFFAPGAHCHNAACGREARAVLSHAAGFGAAALAAGWLARRPRAASVQTARALQVG
ncbi:MAG: hypothetical protein V3T33_06240 [Myxococcota bacterium]